MVVGQRPGMPWLPLLIALLLFAGIARADAFDEGLAAYVRADYANALKAWAPLAEGGDSNAQHNVGIMYENGQGMARDHAAAARMYRRAAAQGHADAQFNLGTLYETGRGVPQDAVRAHMWFNVSATTSLGGMLWSGTAALAAREAAAAKMTPAEIAQAQQMARRCQESNFWACD